MTQATEAAGSVLRPTRLSELVGAQSIKDDLYLSVRAAAERKEPIDHVLLAGPPGLGKTTIANVIAAETGGQLVCVSGPAIDSVQKLVTMVMNLHFGAVLFVDEIHRLPKTVEEVLYSVLEDSTLYCIMGRSVVSKVLPKFTVVGATTRYAMIAPPLRDRFGSVYRLDYYSTEDLEKIVTGAAAAMGVIVDAAAGREIAQRGRGTPRITLKLLKKVRDYAQVLGNGRLTVACAQECLGRMGIDEIGLDTMDYRYLDVLINQCNGGPAGVEVLAARCSEDEQTVADTVEPYLMRIGFLDRSPKGRCATPEAMEWLYKHKEYVK